MLVAVLVVEPNSALNSVVTESKDEINVPIALSAFTEGQPVVTFCNPLFYTREISPQSEQKVSSNQNLNTPGCPVPAGKRKDAGSTPRFCSPFSSKIVIYGHYL